MALTELQLPSKTLFYQKLQNAANRLNSEIKTISDLAEFIDKCTVTDLDAMGVPSGQVRTDLNNFRTMLGELLTFYSGAQVTATNDPEDVIDLIRSI